MGWRKVCLGEIRAGTNISIVMGGGKDAGRKRKETVGKDVLNVLTSFCFLPS